MDRTKIHYSTDYLYQIARICENRKLKLLPGFDDGDPETPIIHTDALAGNNLRVEQAIRRVCNAAMKYGYTEVQITVVPWGDNTVKVVLLPKDKSQLEVSDEQA